MSRTRLHLGLAAGCGVVHAAFSAYWAFGGRWLLDTVGTWAVDWTEQAPVTAGLSLLAVAVAKLVAAGLPLAVAAGRWPTTRAWRVLLLTGAVGLTAYGAANTVGAWLVLGGVVDDGGTRDEAALLGHAVLWDPLFAAWGVLLALGLRRLARVSPPTPSRSGRAAAQAPAPDERDAAAHRARARARRRRIASPPPRR